MRIEYTGLSEITGPLLFLDGVRGATFEEMIEIVLDSGEGRHGRVMMINGERVAVQVFEGTRGISLVNTRTRFPAIRCGSLSHPTCSGGSSTEPAAR
jgi:V/A-type H+-transporting ATPase subunit B